MSWKNTINQIEDYTRVHKIGSWANATYEVKWEGLYFFEATAVGLVDTLTIALNGNAEALHAREIMGSSFAVTIFASCQLYCRRGDVITVQAYHDDIEVPETIQNLEVKQMNPANPGRFVTFGSSA